MTDLDRVWADFEEPSGVRAQYYGGEIVMQGNPTMLHDLVGKSIVRQIGEPYDAWGQRGIDLGVDGTPRPDVAILRLEDVDLTVRDLSARLLQVVVEVVSPGKRAWHDDWHTKRELYAERGIGWYLIVDPRAGTWHLLEYQSAPRVYTQHSEGIFGQAVAVPLEPVALHLDTTTWHPYPA